MTEKVILPGGLQHGQKIKIPMMGHAADVFTSAPGDLLLTIEVKPHDLFTADGKNIRSTVELSLSEAILGCTMTIATVHGPLNIEVPAGICTGTSSTLKHMGMPEFDSRDADQDEVSQRGDHIVTFVVVNDLTANNKRDELLKRFVELESTNKDSFYSVY